LEGQADVVAAGPERIAERQADICSARIRDDVVQVAVRICGARLSYEAASRLVVDASVAAQERPLGLTRD
jgi:hypothetical protein